MAEFANCKAHGCAEQFDKHKGPGRARRFCSDLCRQAEYRRQIRKRRGESIRAELRLLSMKDVEQSLDEQSRQRKQLTLARELALLEITDINENQNRHTAATLKDGSKTQKTGESV